MWYSVTGSIVPIGQLYSGQLRPGDRAATVDEVAAWQAAQPLQPVTFLQFMALFTPTEQAAIVGSTDPQVKLFTLMASGAGEVDPTNPEVAAGVNYLGQSGLIASARVAQVLALQPPA